MDNNVEGGIHRPPRFCTLASAPAAAGVAAPAAVGVAPAARPAPAGSGRISFAKRQRDMVCRCLVE